MKLMGENRLLRWITIIALVFYPLCGWSIIAVGETEPGPVKPTTSFTHRAPDHFVSGHRIELTAGINDREGIELARCYFKASEQADFVFVEMSEVKGDDYRAVLPAPVEGTGRIDYFFLASNQAGAVTRTQEFYLFQSEREEVPGWQEVDAEEPLTVKTELAEAPEELAGFSDSITMDTVESAARLVVVAGGVGGITMVTAGSGGGTILGMSVTTAAIVGGGAAAAGAGAAVAASSGSGGGGNGGDDEQTQPGPETGWDLTGRWTGSHTVTSDPCGIYQYMQFPSYVDLVQEGNSVAFYPDGRYGATGTISGNRLRLSVVHTSPNPAFPGCHMEETAESTITSNSYMTMTGRIEFKGSCGGIEGCVVRLSGYYQKVK